MKQTANIVENKRILVPIYIITDKVSGASRYGNLL